MKEDNQNVGATAFDYPDSVAPRPYNEIKYGNQHVPRPTNNAAKVAPKGEAMRAVLEGK